MTNQNNIQDELRNLNSGLPVENSQNPYSVPEGYFDGLAASVLAKIKQQQPPSVTDELKELSPLLAGLSKQTPYVVPEGYFEQNINSISSVWKDEESAVLSYIGKVLPYDVPAGYFDDFPKQILAKITKPQAKVVPLFARKWMRAAVAAVVGGIMVIAGYQVLNNNNKKDVVATTPPSVNTVQNQTAKNESPTVKAIRNASTEELEDFIKTVPVTPNKVHKLSTQPAEKKEVEQLLDGVTVSDMDAFLDQVPTTDDDLSVTNETTDD